MKSQGKTRTGKKEKKSAASKPAAWEGIGKGTMLREAMLLGNKAKIIRTSLWGNHPERSNKISPRQP